MSHRAAFAEIVHDGAEQANPHGIEQERDRLSRASQQFGVERVKGVDLHAQRATRCRQSFAKIICLNRIGNDNDNRRQRLVRQHLPHALDDALGFAVSRGGEDELGHK